MRIWSLRTAATMVANAIVFFLPTMALLAAATAIVEHTFVVSIIDPLFHRHDLPLDLPCIVHTVSSSHLRPEFEFEFEFASIYIYM
jgi:hypothetical protein